MGQTDGMAGFMTHDAIRCHCICQERDVVLIAGEDSDGIVAPGVCNISGWHIGPHLVHDVRLGASGVHNGQLKADGEVGGANSAAITDAIVEAVEASTDDS